MSDNLDALYTAMCILLNQKDDASTRKKISLLITMKPSKDIEPSVVLNEFVDLSEQVTDSLSWRLPESVESSARTGREIFGFCRVRCIRYEVRCYAHQIINPQGLVRR